jgi:hypothetical protein
MVMMGNDVRMHAMVVVVAEALARWDCEWRD